MMSNQYKTVTRAPAPPIRHLRAIQQQKKRRLAGDIAAAHQRGKYHRERAWGLSPAAKSES